VFGGVEGQPGTWTVDPAMFALKLDCQKNGECTITIPTSGGMIISSMLDGVTRKSHVPVLQQLAIFPETLLKSGIVCSVDVRTALVVEACAMALGCTVPFLTIIVCRVGDIHGLVLRADIEAEWSVYTKLQPFSAKKDSDEPRAKTVAFTSDTVKCMPTEANCVTLKRVRVSVALLKKFTQNVPTEMMNIQFTEAVDGREPVIITWCDVDSWVSMIMSVQLEDPDADKMQAETYGYPM
jgi:hypothetical protein